MTTVKYLITVGGHTAELTPDEGRVVAEGEITRGMVKRLAELGIPLPPRGTTKFQLQIHIPDLSEPEGFRIIRTEAHMRRMPTWERREAA